MRYLWEEKPFDTTIAHSILQRFGVHPVIARILAGRFTNIDDVERYLNPDVDMLFDPFLLNDCRKAVDLINATIKAGHKICVYGDYDVDGVTATVVLITILHKLGANASWYIPNRLDEGYGLTVESIDFLKGEQVHLVITVDCGITDDEAVSHAKAIGMNVIITDHHIPHATMPEADAIVNPKIGDYPFKDLAGVGVAYKLATALNGSQPKELLDLVAVGTVSDVVPLLSENRIIVKNGLNAVHNKALQYLINQVNNGKQLTPDDVSFKIAPRINAVGRLGHANDAVRLLFEQNMPLIQEWVQTIELLNSQRRAIEEEIYREACDMISKLPRSDSFVIVLNSDHWHSGVIGIVASRIAENYNRPVLLMNSAEEMARGSGRSIANIHLHDMVKSHEVLFERVGGHKHAVGFTIRKDRIDELRQKLNQYFKEKYSMKEIIPILYGDATVEIGELDSHYFNDLQSLMPFGYMNPKPVLIINELFAPHGFSIAAERHLRGFVTNGNVKMSCIGFDFASHILKLTKNIDIAGAVEISSYDGLPQIKIRDIRNHIRNLAGAERKSMEHIYRLIREAGSIHRTELTYSLYEKYQEDLMYLDWILLIFEELELIYSVGDMISINSDIPSVENKEERISGSTVYRYVLEHNIN